MGANPKALAKNLLVSLEVLIHHKPHSINAMWELEVPLETISLWMLIRDYLRGDPEVITFARKRFDEKVKESFEEPYQKGVRLA